MKKDSSERWLGTAKGSLIIGLIILTSAISEVKAQRYIPNQKAIQLTGGTVDGAYIYSNQTYSFHSGIALSQYNRKGNRWVYGVEFLYKEYLYSATIKEFNQYTDKSYLLARDIAIPKAQITVEGGHYYKFLSNGSRSLFLAFGTSALLGYETSNWGDKRVADGATIIDQDSFIYGGAVTLETELFLSDWLVLLLNVRERALWGSDIGKFHTQLGTGVKFIID